MEQQLKRVQCAFEMLVACDGADGSNARWWSGRPIQTNITPERRMNVAACFHSWELALARSLEIGSFPCLILEDDTLLACALHTDGNRLTVPADAELIALANGPSLAAHRLGKNDAWLTASSAKIRAHCHSNGAMLLPSAEACAKLLAFLRARPSIFHVDRVMQAEYAERLERGGQAGGRVYHAIPSLLGWVESVSDIEGVAGWVRPANDVRRLVGGQGGDGAAAGTTSKLQGSRPSDNHQSDCAHPSVWIVERNPFHSEVSVALAHLVLTVCPHAQVSMYPALPPHSIGCQC